MVYENNILISECDARMDPEQQVIFLGSLAELMAEMIKESSYNPEGIFKKKVINEAVKYYAEVFQVSQKTLKEQVFNRL